MKNSIFSSTMTGKALRSAQATHKRAVREALRDYSAALDGAFRRVATSADKSARDVYNAMRGKLAAAAAEEITDLVSAGQLDARGARLYVAAYMVAKCYPWQAEDGTLLCKRTEEREDGERVRVWRAQKLTKSAADKIAQKSMDAFISACGNPVPEMHADGELVSVAE